MSTKVPYEGQTGTRTDLIATEMTVKELRILRMLDPTLDGPRRVLTITELAELTGWAKRVGVEKANSWVRNNLRRPVRAGLIEHHAQIKDGRYLISELGRKKLRTFLETK